MQVAYAAQPEREDLPDWALWVFFLLTFAITWGVIAPYILFPEWTSKRFGAISGTHPGFFLATWAPAISAFVLVFALRGTDGLRAFLSRLLLWRLPITWVAFIAIALPVVFVAGSLIKGGPVLAPIPEGGLGEVFAVLAIMLFLGPVEEFGWRGVAQPLLQRHVAPFWAGVVIGTAWGLWHLPAFYLAGTVFAEWSFLPFFVGNVTLAVLVTPIFNASRGSLLWPMLFHWQLINPFWPDAQPWDTWILVGVTALVVWLNRKMLFAKNGGVTAVCAREF
jgi:membrane protease YdiL (CAAX protease family)